MSADYVISPPPQPTIAVAGTSKVFPVRRIWCVGRNYIEHIREMGQDERAPPFFFAKPADAIVDVYKRQTPSSPMRSPGRGGCRAGAKAPRPDRSALSSAEFRFLTRFSLENSAVNRQGNDRPCPRLDAP